MFLCLKSIWFPNKQRELEKHLIISDSKNLLNLSYNAPYFHSVPKIMYKLDNTSNLHFQIVQLCKFFKYAIEVKISKF